MLTFKEETHEYRWKGKTVPSVTQVLKPISGYDGIPKHILDAAAERGTTVHLMTEMDDYGTLGEYPEEYQPYLDAWRTFKFAHNVEIELVECRIYHSSGYAGMLDRIIRVKGKRILMDIKTTAKHMPSVGPQTAAYLQAFTEMDPDDPCKERWSVRLQKDGRFDLTKLKDRSDLSTFNSCLNITRWKQKHD